MRLSFNYVYSHILNYLWWDPTGKFSFERKVSTLKFSIPLPNTQKFHHIWIEKNKVNGAFLTKSCPCHNKEATDDDNDDDECKESIKPIIGQFYHVKHKLFVIAKVLCVHKMTLKKIYVHLLKQPGKLCIPLILPIKPGFIKMMFCDC